MTKTKRNRNPSFGSPAASGFDVFDYPFYLMNQVEHRYYAIMDRIFKEDKISRPIWRILLILRNTDHLSVTHIAEHTAIMRPTVSRILERMENSQLIERRTRSDDNRITDIYLLGKGKKVIDKAVEDVAKQYERTVSGLKNAELKTFNKVLLHMLGNLKGLPWIRQ